VLKYLTAIIILLFTPNSIFAGYFEDSLKEMISEKIDGQVSVVLKFPQNSQLDTILSQEENIESISLSFFSHETKSFKVVSVLSNNKQIELFGKYESFFEVPVASRYIRHGNLVSEDDIKITKVKKLKEGEAPIKNMRLVFGMEAKKSIAQGDVIKLADLKHPPIIKENDPVTLVYISSDITLKTSGFALSAGSLGEKIRVKNEKTGVVVFGEIVEKNVVKVSTEDDK
jgi:flagella basal body P-ring formation protein FlgA